MRPRLKLPGTTPSITDDVASINTNANHVKLTTDFKGEKIVIYKNKS